MSSKNNITILLAGDFCSRPSATHIEVDVDLQSLISASDLAVVNFETPLLPPHDTAKDRKLFQHHDSVPFLKGLGFSLFNICNNHILDYGIAGVRETITQLGKDSIMGLSNGNIITPYYKDVCGCKIAFIPLCYDSYVTDTRNDICVNCVSSPSVQNVIREAQEKSDYVIVLPHDGIEYIPIPTPYLRSLYKQFVDWGANAVVATHPHCIQGAELYNGSPIVYSLGNMFFNSKNTLDFKTNLYGWYHGMLVKLILNNGHIDVEYIFTENVLNRRLILNNSQTNVDHFRDLCAILLDQGRYAQVVESTMLKLLNEKYLSTMDCLFRIRLRSKQGWKYLLKQIYLSIRNIGCSTAYLKFIMRSNTERNFFVESLNRWL